MSTTTRYGGWRRAHKGLTWPSTGPRRRRTRPDHSYLLRPLCLRCHPQRRRDTLDAPEAPKSEPEPEHEHEHEPTTYCTPPSSPSSLPGRLTHSHSYLVLCGNLHAYPHVSQYTPPRSPPLRLGAYTTTMVTLGYDAHCRLTHVLLIHTTSSPTRSLGAYTTSMATRCPVAHPALTHAVGLIHTPAAPPYPTPQPGRLHHLHGQDGKRRAGGGAAAARDGWVCAKGLCISTAVGGVTTVLAVAGFRRNHMGRG